MNCPGLAKLRLLLDGKLNADEFRPIEVHLEECASCQTTLQRLLTEAKQPVAPPEPADPYATVPGNGGNVTTPVSASSGAVTRYPIKHFHAKGGLGEVFVAEDPPLNRDVALKRVQARFEDDPESRRRFLQEAEITARREHPGVVPVYGMDKDATQRR
jgi:hypothetical protein